MTLQLSLTAQGFKKWERDKVNHENPSNNKSNNKTFDL